jgi:hypothetical protein
MKRRAVLRSAGIAVTVTLAGCFQEVESGDGSSPTAADAGSETATESGGNVDVEYRNTKLVRENEGTPDETVAVTGTVVNTSDGDYPLFEVVVTFLNESGESLGTASASTTYFYPDSKWDFEAEYEETGEAARAVTDFELSGQAG